MYICFCPLGDTCGKKGKRIGSYRSEEEARDAVSLHLQRSSYHEMGPEEASSYAAAASLDVEEWPETADPPQEQKGGKGWRSSHPYKGYEKGYEKGQGKQAGKEHIFDRTRALATPGQASSSSGGGAPVLMQMRLEAQAQKLEAAARAAVKFCRQAQLAFEEECANIRDVIEDLRKV